MVGPPFPWSLHHWWSLVVPSRAVPQKDSTSWACSCGAMGPWGRPMSYSGWWFQTWLLFSIIYHIYIYMDGILPTDKLIFFKMAKTTNQHYWKTRAPKHISTVKQKRKTIPSQLDPALRLRDKVMILRVKLLGMVKSINIPLNLIKSYQIPYIISNHHIIT